MSVLYTIAVVLQEAVVWAWRLAQVAGLVMGVWALIDSALRSPSHYVAAGKRTKGFWLGVNAAGLGVVALMGAASMLGLLGVVANAVYLADVRPALRYYAPVRVRSSIRIPGRASQRRPGGPGSGPRDWRPGR
ncbi:MULTISPECIES: DUF2516 family protein [Actinomyces]|uniref:DUF2516 family protein n=1 Tax=Actinomyces bowdenii TaxID=131109 RepID=A0A853ELB5_9ACTO|nr:MULTISPECIES: DUF2516 family protein [Actinomyces]MBF0697944.1 DUF2516 family protein [Actinomyces bowdenii]MCR2051585.1 DUF2516 family protein [Actinomyces bowdenii]MDO5065101.1 DUF2516 family protein [Actinomyces bowdenii]NYS70117.1 DUF2516 family protein [Actinomyces bowdenii]